MAIKKYHRNEGRDDYVSKTSIKADAHALTKWGQELAAMPASTLLELPLSEVTLKALLDYQKITSNLASKRQLMFVGKCLRKEDETQVKEKVELLARQKNKPKTPITKKMNPKIKQLLSEGEKAVEKIISNNEQYDRQKLRQLYRNYEKAVLDKKERALKKLEEYLG